MRSYEMLSELALPFFAAAAYLRGGLPAAKHALTINAAPPPSTASGQHRYLLWVHGASIGETLSALPIVRRLLKRSKHAQVLITASTPNALSRLELESLGPRVILRNRPADAGSSVRRFLRHWRPNGLLLVESELWPNLVVQTRAAGVPIALINGRMSERSLARWRAFAPVALRQLLACCSVALAQSPRMAARLQEALADADRMTPCEPAPRMHAARVDAPSDSTPSPHHPEIVYRGDLKQISRRRSRTDDCSDNDSYDRVELRAQLLADIMEARLSLCGHADASGIGSRRCESSSSPGSAASAAASPPEVAAETAAAVDAHGSTSSPSPAEGKVWLAASTHEGEERAILEAHSMLRRNGHPQLLLLLVPRHVERGPQIKARAETAVSEPASPIERAGAPDTSHSRLASSSRGGPVALRSVGDPVGRETSVYVCDTLGELPHLYGLCGVAFVGGSLVPLGGHSLLEAAQADGGCAVLHGPHVEAVEEAARALAASEPPAAQMVTGAHDLAHALDALLSDASLRRACRGAAARTARELEAGVLDSLWEELRTPLRLPTN